MNKTGTKKEKKIKNYKMYTWNLSLVNNKFKSFHSFMVAPATSTQSLTPTNTTLN